MEAIQAYYNGTVFVPMTPVKVKLNQTAIITILDTTRVKQKENRYSKFFGALSSESALEFEEALKDTEKVDKDEW